MSITITELWRMSTTDLAEAIRSRHISSQEVIEAHLQRIEAVNPSVNAVRVVPGEQALEAAKAADRAVVGGGNLPPFHGIPFTVKKDIDLTGTPTTQGLKAFAGAYPSRDAPVERFKAAGAIPPGRTNCPSFAVRWHCESELWGATVNPWDRSRAPGARSRWRGRSPRHRHESIGAWQRWARIAPLAGPMLRHLRGLCLPWAHPSCDHRRNGGWTDWLPVDGRPRSAGPSCG